MKTLRLLTCILVLLALAGDTPAQKPAMNWYFGQKAGLDFNSGTPVPVLGSSMWATEGCTSISDSNGNLLFYTYGDTVWNKNHQPMPNGFGLFGHQNSTQSALIVPLPGSST